MPRWPRCPRRCRPRRSGPRAYTRAAVCMCARAEATAQATAKPAQPAAPQSDEGKNVTPQPHLPPLGRPWPCRGRGRNAADGYSGARTPQSNPPTRQRKEHRTGPLAPRGGHLHFCRVFVALHERGRASRRRTKGARVRGADAGTFSPTVC